MRLDRGDTEIGDAGFGNYRKTDRLARRYKFFGTVAVRHKVTQIRDAEVADHLETASLSFSEVVIGEQNDVRDRYFGFLEPLDCVTCSFKLNNRIQIAPSGPNLLFESISFVLFVFENYDLMVLTQFDCWELVKRKKKKKKRP